MVDPAEKGTAGRSQADLERLTVAMENPVRMRLMVLLESKPGSGVSELARWTGEPERSLRGHLDALLEAELIAVGHQEPRRGVSKHYFVNLTLPWITNEEDDRMSVRDRQLTSLATARVLFDEVKAALGSEVSMARTDRVIVNSAAEIDEQGWEELAKLHLELLEETRRIVEESRERLASGEAEPIFVTSGQILLELPPLPAAD